jgi:hypothetical protein
LAEVCASAAANVRQGAVSEQALASLPVADTKLRGDAASAAVDPGITARKLAVARTRTKRDVDMLWATLSGVANQDSLPRRHDAFNLALRDVAGEARLHIA